MNGAYPSLSCHPSTSLVPRRVAVLFSYLLTAAAYGDISGTSRKAEGRASMDGPTKVDRAEKGRLKKNDNSEIFVPDEYILGTKT